MQKLQALALRFYQGYTWVPKAGDHYTTVRADLELYRVVRVEGSVVYTEYTDRECKPEAWELSEFTSAGFGIHRVYVPDWILNS
jgi:hypothetical protein